MELLKCENCQKEFTGRSTRRYCCRHCQRRMERRRARWDKWASRADRLAVVADKVASQERRAELKTQAGKIRKQIGPRP
jgi:uncharacterized Zn ribbon protein